MSTLQRTPENFPRMRVRGGRRRAYQRTSQQRNAFHNLGHMMNGIDWNRLATSIMNLGGTVKDIFKNLEELSKQWTKDTLPLGAESDTMTQKALLSEFSENSLPLATGVSDNGLTGAKPGTSRSSHD